MSLISRRSPSPPSLHSHSFRSPSSPSLHSPDFSAPIIRLRVSFALENGRLARWEKSKIFSRSLYGFRIWVDDSSLPLRCELFWSLLQLGACEASLRFLRLACV
ncbi:hypothetical protein KFK09_009177 [Dendrobium nobile]|uniref:Uncharacterized protein n=1 Tax=Dendrobium nobile TaxID=94219 RepID=A0A8T3BMN8_DENNO|nr:hypothetical protein KFK09_009177 [Dendrobium nobile]